MDEKLVKRSEIQFQGALPRKRYEASKILLIGLVLLALVLAGFQPVLAREVFPPTIPLPVGFQPEGIAVGKGTTFYVGSIPTGAIYSGDLRTGEGAVLVPAQEGRSAIGLSFDERSGYLFVAGGMTGEAYVYDGSTGETVAVYTLTTEEEVFINDVVVTREAAYFTNSLLPEIYRVPLGPGGSLPDQDEVETIELGGEYVQGAGFNVNGIDATPNGKWLVIVNSGQGALYRVDPETGFAVRIDLGGATVPAGDGILLHGRTLYVVQNRLNQIAVIELSPDLTSGEIVDTITDEDFRVPTTIAEFGRYLYAVNARFGVNNPEEADFEVVQVLR